MGAAVEVNGHEESESSARRVQQDTTPLTAAAARLLVCLACQCCLALLCLPAGWPSPSAVYLEPTHGKLACGLPSPSPGYLELTHDYSADTSNTCLRAGRLQRLDIWSLHMTTQLTHGHTRLRADRLHGLLLGLHDVGQRGVARLVQPQVAGHHRRQRDAQLQGGLRRVAG